MTSPIVKRYIIAFDKYKWIGLASFALVVAGASVVAILPEPQPSYIADGALAYTRPPVSFSATGTEIQQQGQELSKQVLLSDQILQTVSTKVNVKPETIQTNVALTLPERSRTGELLSTIIELRYQDTDPKQARQILQELMGAMIGLSGDINTGRLKAIIEKINERIPQAKSDLQTAEQKLEQYDRRERPAILAAENGSLLGAVTNSQNQQRLIQLTIAGIDAQIGSLQDKLGLNVGQAYVSSALSADPILSNLRSQIYQVESQITLLSKDLRPENPTMIQLARQKQSIEELLQQRAAEVVGGGGTAAPLPGDVSGIRAQSNLDPARQQLANQMVGLETQRETLQQQLAQQIREEERLRQDYSQIPNKQLERSRLQQEVALKKAIYDQMQAKLTDSKTAEAETVSSLTVARLPNVVSDSSQPQNVPLTLGVGSFLGLLVGGGVIFLLGSLDGTFKTKEDIRDSLRQREITNLGELPLMPVDDLAEAALPVILSPDSPYLEFYEKVRSNFRRIGGKKFKMLLITSTSSQEGKTVTAYNLGIASALAGKRTLIIETDLRSPSHASSLNVSPDTDVSVEPLRYYARLNECIRLVPEVENLYIIPSPGPVSQSSAILESSEIKRLMEDVRERFDLVILDTNPLSSSNDALLIQPYSDGIVLVARPNHTQENMLGEAIDQLVESELGLLGVIVNGADIIVSPSQAFSPQEEAGVLSEVV
ncbi:polysaccharide biosynthesis tyrosine autokinase [Nodularia spumigena CS-591/04]|uniref:GumC family protein n=1 Tax=Nodularia spumigena TaxID=70799 RepID=UPI0023309004|nr:polysaccharide biosynthesis tyrosine autokinase [Nodularia spumigena]MDB9323062.1 polysaccharide biosynthesis tyrosine autokinase [Nodularia spumigena CS-591/07A]MDB9333321.1 polysaccharide biosynthesis tyrosine autokinase [Nodularia spumigena CS-591/04]MDB9349899.1 polysaccharide biosynthesis tyrosine autokinase [Nodularia spumigena CS-588/01]MDB9351882.1 polysaccharide biosynthesis tyrosine autokinase [Nodularia spumigena CS-588/05]MDB9359942.1 polysaccharide biosynthesis tyrosine autokin